MAERFYHAAPPIAGMVSLNEDESHHLSRVSRHQVGDFVIVFDGLGHEYDATIETIDKRSTTLHITEARHSPRSMPGRLVLASAIPKGDRFDMLLEKITELGVHQFIPLNTERGVVVPSAEKLPKWQRQTIEACKQSGRNQLPQIDEPKSLAAILADTALPSRRWQSVPGSMVSLQERLYRPDQPRDLLILVGPEGGWTKSELALAAENGVQTIGLGPRILRIETACLAIAATVAALWEAN